MNSSNNVRIFFVNICSVLSQKACFGPILMFTFSTVQTDKSLWKCLVKQIGEKAFDEFVIWCKSIDCFLFQLWEVLAQAVLKLQGTACQEINRG